MSACVYRIFDEAGELIYIGSTVNLRVRIAGHFSSPWSCADPEAIRERFHTLTTDYYPTVEEARAVEKRAITEEAPLVNRKDNPTRWRKAGLTYEPVPA